jgi:HSP20 family molecular chaperone IbpA
MKNTMPLFDRIPSIFPTTLVDSLTSSFIFDELDAFFANPKLRVVYPVDIYNVVSESEKVISTVIEIAVAGVPKDACTVKIEENKLLVQIGKSEQEEAKNKKMIQKQISKRTANMSWILNDKVDKKQISVQYVDGILKINLPFVESELNEPIVLPIQ